MPTDQLVQAADVLAAVRQLRHRPREKVLEELERLEPDLIEHILEELSAVHQQLLQSGVTDRRVRGIYRRVETLTLLGLLALRHATLRLWCDQLGEQGLAQLDPSASRPDEEAPPADGE